MARTQIRLLKTLAEFQECERIQRAVWGAVSVASELMLVTQKYGGTVLGGLVDSECVGFVYALPAPRHGRPIHWSPPMAVPGGLSRAGDRMQDEDGSSAARARTGPQVDLLDV